MNEELLNATVFLRGLVQAVEAAVAFGTPLNQVQNINDRVQLCTDWLNLVDEELNPV